MKTKYNILENILPPYILLLPQLAILAIAFLLDISILLNCFLHYILTFSDQPKGS